MASQFVDVEIESSPELPESMCMRWKANTLPRAVRRVRYSADDGWEGVCDVVGRAPDGGPSAAFVCEVEDSAAGTSCLVWGGRGGIRLQWNGLEAIEPYLLLAPDDVLD